MSEGKGILTFKKDPQHYASLINGAYGSVFGDGVGDLIEVHFFCETNPEIERIEIDLSTGKEVARFPQEVAKERSVKFTGVMTLQTAQSIAEWLLKNIDDVKKAKAGRQAGSGPGQVH